MKHNAGKDWLVVCLPLSKMIEFVSWDDYSKYSQQVK